MIKYHVYGDPEKPALCILPGAGLGTWAYNQIIPLVSSKFYVIIPAISDDFTSIEDIVYQLNQLITNQFNGKIQTLAGLSIGAQIALDLISKYPDLCNSLLLESCAIFPQSISKLIPFLINLSYPLTRFEFFNKLQAAALYLPPNEYKSYDQEIKKMSKQTLTNILMANANFNIKNILPLKFKGKVSIVYGTKETKLIIKSSAYLSKKFVAANLLPLKNYHHGELTLKHPDEFLQIINQLNN